MGVSGGRPRLAKQARLLSGLQVQGVEVFNRNGKGNPHPGSESPTRDLRSQENPAPARSDLKIRQVPMQDPM